MSNPRNDQVALDRQHEEALALEESLRVAAYADAGIRREKQRGYPVDPLNDGITTWRASDLRWRSRG